MNLLYNFNFYNNYGTIVCYMDYILGRLFYTLRFILDVSHSKCFTYWTLICQFSMRLFSPGEDSSSFQNAVKVCSIVCNVLKN